MTAAVETIDFDAVFADITERIQKEKERRLIPPLVRLWDGDWNLRGYVKRENSASFQYIDNETGTGVIEMPADYYLSRWVVDVHKRPTTNVHITVDKDGARWGGRLAKAELIKDETGNRFVRATFRHDYEDLKHILVYANPFLPPEVQFPRTWILYGNARWCLKTTLLVNLVRLNASLWTLPDDPMDPSQWFNFNQATWSMVVKPDLTPDNSVAALVHGRFKYMHDVSKNVAADAQLSWECRRYLDGDEPPWPGANLKHGCLVWDLVDKSGWNTGTSFGGDMFSGLVHSITDINVSEGDKTMSDTTRTLPDPNAPAEYSQPGWKGTLPEMPGVVFYDTEHSGIQSSNWTWQPATDVGYVAGGHSMPGVNALLDATVSALGDLTAVIPGVPPMGGVAQALLAPLYTDVFLAFGKWKDPARAQRLGWSHYHEKWADGGDAAYTIAWLIAMRTAAWQTRETISHTLTISDGASGYRIGQQGHGHFFLGDRIGSTILGTEPGRIFIDRVSELTIAWSRTDSPQWKIQVGEREPEDPLIKAYEQMQDMLSTLRELGVI